MNNPSVLSTEGQLASDFELAKEKQRSLGGSRERLLGHIVLTLLFLVAVLLRMLL